jgi:Kef-type K+ transport system membrane component KefB
VNNHSDIVTVLLQLGCLLAVSRGLGEIAKKFGQPAVIGELLAGILLGKAFFGSLGITWFYEVAPVVEQSLKFMSLLGLIFLLLLTGLETDFALIRRNIRSAVLVSLGGLLIPLGSGYLVGMSLPASLAGSPEGVAMLPPFLAVCMGISALPVIGKVLIELKMMRRNVAQTLIAAAMLEDATGWIILSVILAILDGGHFSISQVFSSIFLVVGFISISLIFGRKIVSVIFRNLQHRLPGADISLSAVIVLAFLWSALAQYLGLESIFGAFVFGVILGLVPSLNNQVVHIIHTMTMNIFAPLFFALAGLRVDVLAAFTADTILVTLLIIVVAIACKGIGGYLGGRYLAKMSHAEGIFLGIGLNARGSMGVIVATIGLSVGVLSLELFSSIVIMAIVTSLIAPPLLSWASTGIPLAGEEKVRIVKEELKKDSLVSGVKRVLIPIRARDVYSATSIHKIEAYITEHLADDRQIDLTLFTVVEKEEEVVANTCLDILAPLFKKVKITKKIIIGKSTGNAIVEEANLSYDLLLMGTPVIQGNYQQVFTPLIDYVARLSPCPVVFVRTIGESTWEGKLKNILVPTNGSVASRRGADLAFALARSSSEVTKVTLLKVLESADEIGLNEILERQRRYSIEHLEELESVGKMMGALTTSFIEVDSQPERVIIDYSKINNCDLIIIGTSARIGAERLFLGPRVERILELASCPVLVINA